MTRTKLILTTLAFIPHMSWAFFCPNNFRQINIGDSIETVKQECGKPDIETTKKEEKNTPQEWSYFIPQTVSTANSYEEMQGTLKTSMAFDADGKLVNISVNGIGVGSTQICGADIQLGDTKDSVKAACGNPSYINKSSQNEGQSEKNKITLLTYKVTPPVTLVFVNGVLTEQK